MSSLRTALVHIAGATAAWAGFLFLAGELHPGGAFMLYTSLLAVYALHQLWSAYRDHRERHTDRS